MSPLHRNVFLFSILALSSAALAQQGVLTNGNSQLPACAQGCSVLQQAAQACSGTTSANQATWVCFCQSGYLAHLYNTDTGICSSVCSGSDSTQVSTWYRTNCGTDDGASEHPDTGAAQTSTSTSTSTSASSSATAASGSSNTSGQSTSSSAGMTWWNTHWRWIVMVIVLAVGLFALAMLLIWLKKRYKRKRDQAGIFNEGITTRQAPMTTTAQHGNASFVSGGASEADVANSNANSNGANTPVRTRDAFMPYGYGYARSESRLGYQAERGSPLARGGTPPGEEEKNVEGGPTGSVATPDPAVTRKKSARRVLVRERSRRSETATPPPPMPPLPYQQEEDEEAPSTIGEAR